MYLGILTDSCNADNENLYHISYCSGIKDLGGADCKGKVATAIDS